MTKIRSLRTLLGLGAAVVLLCAASDGYVVGPAPVSLLPANTPEGAQIVTPGAVVARAMIGRPAAAILLAGFTLDRAGEKRVFRRSQVLHAAGISNVPGNPETIFCDEEKQGSLGKVMTGQMLFGLVGALRPTRLDTQYCVFDSDSDLHFDHAFLIGAKGKQRAPFKIAPVEYAVIEGSPIGGNSELRLRYAGPVGAADSLSFDIEAEGFGRLRDVPDSRRPILITKLPAYGIVAGAVLTILDYNPKTRAATIRVDRDLAPGHFVLPEPNNGY